MSGESQPEIDQGSNLNDGGFHQEDGKILSASRLIADRSRLKLISQVLSDAVSDKCGVLYSVDEIVFKLQFRNEKSGIRAFELADTVQCDGSPAYFHSNKPNSWRYLYTFKMGEGIVRLGIGWNPPYSKTLMTKGMVVFNPNKIGRCGYIDSLFAKLGRFVRSVELSRFDIAIDIPFDRTNCRMRKDKRGYEYIDHGNGITEYLGTRGKPGRTKLYDKTREAGLDERWTRLELTCNGDWDKEKITEMLPTVYVWDDSSCDEESRSWVKALGIASAKLLDNGESLEPIMSVLSSKARKKIRDYLESPSVKIDPDSVSAVLVKVHEWEDRFNERIERTGSRGTVSPLGFQNR